MSDDIDLGALPPGTPSYIKPVDPMQRQLSPIGFYSHAAEVAARFPQMKGTPQQFKAMLMRQGVKPDELKWSGYDQAFGDQKMVTRDQLAQHFKMKMPKVQETVLDRNPNNYSPKGTPTKYHSYTLPGGKNYREVLLHLPPTPNKLTLWRVMRPDGYVDSSWGSQEQAQRHADRNPGMTVSEAPNTIDAQAGYKSSHWDQPNVLAHLRMSDRKGPKGEKILHLEEMQSDWAQEGRKKGFRDPARETALLRARDEANQRVEDMRTHLRQKMAQGPEIDEKLLPLQEAHTAAYKAHIAAMSGVPSSPYVDSTAKWMDLGLKRVLHEAAKGGYDKVVVTPGEEQANRYDLSKHVDKVNLLPDPSGQFRIDAFKNNEKVLEHFAKDEKEVAAAVGKEVAEKLFNSRNQHGAATLAGQELRIGGEGMKSFYDKLLPQALEKIAKRHDPQARVQHQGHTLSRGKSAANPWHVLGVDGNSVASFANEASARNYVAHMGPDLQIEHRGAGQKLHSLDITPEMRASILRGHAAYADGGSVAAAKPTFAELNALAAEHGANSPQFMRAYEAYNQEPEPEKLQKAAGGSVNHNPTEAQKAAGNYAKERISFQGLPISIENKAGSTRRGVDDKGRQWSSRVPCDYGYIRGTEGADGDHVDCYVGDKPDSNLVVVVNQCDHRNGRFDEHKIILGTNSEREALDLYCRGFSDGRGPDRIGSVEVMSVDGLKKWLKNGATKKPVKARSIVGRALELVARR